MIEPPPKNVVKFFVEDDTLTAILEDMTVEVWTGDEWVMVPSRQCHCEHCGKLLEPHICEVNND